MTRLPDAVLAEARQVEGCGAWAILDVRGHDYAADRAFDCPDCLSRLIVWAQRRERERCATIAVRGVCLGREAAEFIRSLPDEVET